MSRSSIPPFHGNINFNAHHAPMGAFFSFTCGHFGSRGGLGLQLGRPANQNLYIGVRPGNPGDNGQLLCLPFFQPGPGSAGVEACPATHIRRHYGWATDRWVTPDFEWVLYTPFGRIAEPAVSDSHRTRWDLLPAVFAELIVDNTAGKHSRTGFFAVEFDQVGVRLLDRLGRPAENGQDRAGFALGRSLGVAGEMENHTYNQQLLAVLEEARRAQRDGRIEEAQRLRSKADAMEDVAALFPLQGDGPAQCLGDPHPVHRMGRCAGIAFVVPPGQKHSLRLALGAHLDGPVTTGLEGRYFYNRSFADIEAVLGEALDAFLMLGRNAAGQIDQMLLDAPLSDDQRFLIAHSTRSYYGCTQLLDVAGEPLWVVNDGEAGSINALDLAVDQVFWELQQNPWLVRNLLDQWVRRYSYHDQNGISFTRDMGVGNQFSPPGHSAYEMPGRTGRFSFMTQEQLCNWILLAASYVARTDDIRWLQQQAHVLLACQRSLDRRKASASSRCGGGAEITAYDSLDDSLCPARGNLYLAVKCWAAYVGLQMLLESIGEPAAAESAGAAATAAAGKIVEQMDPAAGLLPANLDPDAKGRSARVLPAIEPLIFPLFWSLCPFGRDFRAPGQWLDPEQPLMAALRRHTLTLLGDPKHGNPLPGGGLRLSSTSEQTWISKIVLLQHVARELFQTNDDPKLVEWFRQADAAHVRWLTEGESAYWAMSDRMIGGVAEGGRHSPRGVTTTLWMK